MRRNKVKIIFSRKGFDATAGGFPSPIFPDGMLYSVPIPGSDEKYLYRDLEFKYEGDSIQSILNDLTGRQIRSNRATKPCDYSGSQQHCHHDPLLLQEEDFEGVILGQAGAAEGHLRNRNVGSGDIFLFYGWFKNIEKQRGRWIYSPESRDVHLIWSYMVVGDTAILDDNVQQGEALDRYPFIASHPHVGDQDGGKNRLYISKRSRRFAFHQKRCLTDVTNYLGRSTWRLPSCFDQPAAFSYLRDFSVRHDEVVISYRGFGQEFVLDLDLVRPRDDRELIIGYVNNLVDGELLDGTEAVQTQVPVGGKRD
jgi:hypothetical protein